jgi:hypothetical protein
MSAFTTRSFSRLALLHVVANAILLSLGYYWLGVGESRALTVAWSACLAIVIAILTCCCYGAALVYFQAGDRETSLAWRTALRNIIPLVSVAAMAGAIYWLLHRWSDYSGTPAFSIASFLTLKLRTPIKPPSVQRIFNVALWIVRWAVVPVLLLPAVAAIATRGWDGMREIGSHARRCLYWLEAPLLLLCGFWIPLMLLGWVPSVGTFTMETLSFVVRAALAYLLFAGAWLLLAFVTSAGSPRLTQPSTTDSL